MIKVKDKTPSLNMAGVLKVCKAMAVDNAAEVLAKINQCAQTNEEGKSIVKDVVTYAEIAAIGLNAGFKSSDNITEDDCMEAMATFNDVNDVIIWLTDSIVQVMNPAPADPN